ncbi:MAG TPA: mannitol dehydrogenase family protein [Sphingomonas sp.]|jgi:fructuronate reductase
MRLSQVTADRLPASVGRPDYDWRAQRRGIVHLGVGAFHRAHQAAYTDDAMRAGDRDWAITGVSLRSSSMRDALAPQDALYTLTERGADGDRTRLIGALREVLVAPEAPELVTQALASPDTKLVTITVTEKGYHRRPDGALDLAGLAATGGTIFHHLARALARRRAAKLPGVTILSCDNLTDNGSTLGTLLATYLDHVEPATSNWFASECACPNTMVDRIVPAMTAAGVDAVADTLAMRDEAAVATEPFREWVIENRFAGPRPRWEGGGARLVADVRPYEHAKLRMLNGAHSALAYLGLEAGHDYVHQAVADPALRPKVEALLGEAAASLDPAPGQDLARYADRLVARFANPALQHRLAQIAADGSQKIPQRWLEPLAINGACGRRCPATLEALAAWIVHLRGDDRLVDDPLAGMLRDLWRTAGRAGMIDALFGRGGMLAGCWRPDASDRALLDAFIDQRS